MSIRLYASCVLQGEIAESSKCCSWGDQGFIFEQPESGWKFLSSWFKSVVVMRDAACSDASPMDQSTVDLSITIGVMLSVVVGAQIELVRIFRWRFRCFIKTGLT